MKEKKAKEKKARLFSGNRPDVSGGWALIGNFMAYDQPWEIWRGLTNRVNATVIKLVLAKGNARKANYWLSWLGDKKRFADGGHQKTGMEHSPEIIIAAKKVILEKAIGGFGKAE